MPSYLFRVVGTVGPAIRSAFPALSVSQVPARTVLHGTAVDAAELAEVLDALRGLQIESVTIETRQAAEHHGSPNEPNALSGDRRAATRPSTATTTTYQGTSQSAPMPMKTVATKGAVPPSTAAPNP